MTCYNTAYVLSVKYNGRWWDYSGNMGRLPFFELAGFNRTIKYTSINNALASRRKLWNRYGIKCGVCVCCSYINEGGSVRHSRSTVKFAEAFGNKEVPAFMSRHVSGIYNAFRVGYETAIGDTGGADE